LQIARDESRTLELQPTTLERYLQFASINQYSIAAAVAFWLGILGIAALIFARRRSAALVSLSILCLLVCAMAVLAIHTLDNGSKGRALAIVTGTTGWYLAEDMGFTALSWPQYAWVAAALVLVVLMTIQGIGYLLPTNFRVCLELQKDNPDNARIGALTNRYFFAVALQGVMQIVTIIVMARLATGV